MEKYLITLITKDEEKEPLEKLIDKFGGKVTEKKPLGSKKLNFPIKKQKIGFLYNYSLEMEPKKILPLSKALNLEENILRHIIITHKLPPQIEARKEKVIKVPEKIQEMAKEPIPAAEEIAIEEIPEILPIEEPILVNEEKIESLKAAKEKEDKMAEIEEIISPKEETPVAKPLIKEVTEEAIDEEERLKKLEEKLDEILKE